MNEEQLKLAFWKSKPCRYQANSGNWIPVHIAGYKKTRFAFTVELMPIIPEEHGENFSLIALTPSQQQSDSFIVEVPFDSERLVVDVVDAESTRGTIEGSSR